MWTSKARKETEAATQKLLTNILVRVEQLESTPPPPFDVRSLQGALGELRTDIQTLLARVESHAKRIQEAEQELGRLKLATAEGIERTDRAERRIKATIARARKELRDRGFEDPGLEAEAHEFRDTDGEGGAEGGLRSLPKTVGEPEEEPSSIAGVPLSLLQRARGIGG